MAAAPQRALSPAALLLAALAFVAAPAAAAAAGDSPSPSPSPEPSPTPRPRAPGAVIPLTHAGGGVYTLGLAIGTPAQTVRLAVDTWTSDLWVATPRSVSNSTVPHRAFDAARSESFHAMNVSSHLPYPHAGGGDCSVDVDVGMDFGDLEDVDASGGGGGGGGGAARAPAPNPLTRLGVVFGAASREDDYFLESPFFDGMVGLALDQDAQLDSRGVLSRIANETGEPFLFGLFLAPLTAALPNASGLAVGAWDTRRFADARAQPVFTPVTPFSGFGSGPVFDIWRFAVPHLEVAPPRHADGASAPGAPGAPDAPPESFCGPDASPTGCVAIVDIGHETVGLPPIYFIRIVDAINASVHGRCESGPDDFVLCPMHFDLLPNLTFTVAGTLGAAPERTGGGGGGGGSGGGGGGHSHSHMQSYFDLELTPADYCAPLNATLAVAGRRGPAHPPACRVLVSANGGYHGRAGRGGPSSPPSSAPSSAPSPSPAPPEESVVLLLGAPFLRAFYSVLDARVRGGACVGFAAASASAGVRPSSWQPPSPPPPGGGGSSLPSWLGSKEMWAGVVGVGVGFVITGGLVVVLRDRCREREGRRQMRDELLFGFDESGSIMIEDRDFEEEGFDDDESDFASGLSASVSMPGGSAAARAAAAAEAAAEAGAASEPTSPGAGVGVSVGAGALRLDVGSLQGASSRIYRDAQ